MISKGNTHGDGARLAAYLTTGKANEHAELWQLRGFGMDDITEAFRTVHVIAEATRAERPFFHVQVRNRDGETLTRPQWEDTADRIEGMLGLKDQPRAIAFHIDRKTDGEHMHVAWSRIDEDTLTARPLPFFKERLKKISRELELQFALSPVANERDSEIKFAPTRAEHEQARRLGQDVHELRNTIRECWDRSDCGRSFQGALEHEGFTLAQGDRRGFVVIDGAGGLHVLSKRILDVSAAKIRDRLSDLSDDDLPTVATARAFVEEAKQQQPEPFWDRDQYDQAWQDSVITAAIEGGEADQKTTQSQTDGGVGNRKKECLIRAAAPEIIELSPAIQFKDAAQENVGHTREQIAASPPARTLDIPGAGIAPEQKPEVKPDECQEARAARSKIRTPGLYRKALSLSGIIRQQFRQLASFLTAHVPDTRQALKRMTSSDGGSAAKPRQKHELPSEASTVLEFLSETLDWLSPWNHDTAFVYDSDDDFQQYNHDHLYPHL